MSEILEKSSLIAKQTERNRTVFEKLKQTDIEFANAVDELVALFNKPKEARQNAARKQAEEIDEKIRLWNNRRGYPKNSGAQITIHEHVGTVGSFKIFFYPEQQGLIITYNLY